MGLIINGGTTITSGITLKSISNGGGGIFIPTGSPSAYFGGAADFEMGVWNPSDPANVVDITGNNHSMNFNNQSYSGNVNYAHFLNNSAQANDLTWPAMPSANLAVMGWFAFASFGATTSVVSQNSGTGGWALRLDSAGSEVNLVKYNTLDQKISLGTTLSTNTWHFIGVAQQGQAMYFVVDGTTYMLSGSSTPFNNDSGTPVRLQYDPYTGGNQGVEMWMRDVKIVSSIGLTNTELLGVFNSTKANYGY
jgi:hypothetical protein